MDAIEKHLPAVRRRLAQGFILMLDFDGVLAPLTEHPKDARISKETRTFLRKIAATAPVAVVSGRSLADVRRRVGVKGVTYAGSHGMEWETGGKVHSIAVSKEVQEAFAQATRIMQELAKHHAGSVLEKKFGSVALNYRRLSKQDALACKQELRRALKPNLRPGMLKILDNKKTLEVLTDTSWSKGTYAAMLTKELERRAGKPLVPVYIGDSLTDEEAFKAFKKRGVTIRVGRRSKSAANYFVHNRSDVDAFLSLLIQARSGAFEPSRS